MIFQILTDIQLGNPCQLQKYIDNRNGDKMVGLKSITYWIGWYNVKETQYISVKGQIGSIEPGLYSIGDIKKFFDDAGVQMNVNENSGIATLLIPAETSVFVSSEIMSILGFNMENKKSIVLRGNKSILALPFGEVSGQKRYRGEKPVDIAIPKEIRLCLEQINTETNQFKGAPSTILEILPAPTESYGSVVSIRFEVPSFKKLSNGCITELSACLKDEKNRFLKNNGHRITVELCIK